MYDKVGLLVEIGLLVEVGLLSIMHITLMHSASTDYTPLVSSTVKDYLIPSCSLDSSQWSTSGRSDLNHETGSDEKFSIFNR